MSRSDSLRHEVYGDLDDRIMGPDADQDSYTDGDLERNTGGDIRRSSSTTQNDAGDVTNEKAKAGQEQVREQPAPSHHGPPPPHSAGFFDKTPAMARARASYFKIIGGGMIATTFLIFAVLSIFWGSLWKLNDYIHNLDCWVVVSA